MLLGKIVYCVDCTELCAAGCNYYVYVSRPVVGDCSECFVNHWTDVAFRREAHELFPVGGFINAAT